MAKLGASVRIGAAVSAVVVFLAGCGGVETNPSSSGDGDNYPTGTVEMLVGFSAGGSSDLINRAVAKGLSDELGVSFPVVNREGANGAVAASELAADEPDGSVISVQNASLFVITPLAVGEDEATSIDDFDVIHGISRDDYVFVTNPESGYESIEDLRNATERVTYGTAGVGTGAQLSALLLMNDLGVESTAIPFDGGAPALTALLGNQVDVASLQVGEAIENIEAGKLVPLAVFGPERIEYLPDVPTARELGLEVEVAQYRFLTAPKGTPEEVKERLVEGLEATFQTEEYQQFNEQNSLIPMEIPGDDVLAQLNEDREKFAELIEDYGISLTDN